MSTWAPGEGDVCRNCGRPWGWHVKDGQACFPGRALPEWERAREAHDRRVFTAQALGDLEVDLSDYPDEYVLGFVAGVKAQRGEAGG